jgi:hypothetical protein
MEGIEAPILERHIKAWTSEDFSWWSDRYKEHTGSRPKMNNEQLIAWVNETFICHNDEVHLKVKDDYVYTEVLAEFESLENRRSCNRLNSYGYEKYYHYKSLLENWDLDF